VINNLITEVSYGLLQHVPNRLKSPIALPGGDLGIVKPSVLLVLFQVELSLDLEVYNVEQAAVELLVL
jgi:hypothetical protein